MSKAIVLLALCGLAGFGAVVALGQASPARSGAATSSGGTTVSSGSTVVVNNASSCSISVISTNGVTVTTKTGNCEGSHACAITVSSKNGVTQTTKTGDCSGTATVSTSTIMLPSALEFLRALIDHLFRAFAVAGVF